MGHVEFDRTPSTVMTPDDPMTFRLAGPADIPVLRALAERIWRASYADLLSAAQIDHMLQWMYAADMIADEMRRGVRWTQVFHVEQPVGFMAMSCEPGKPAELHKLYLLPAFQGSGLGQRMLNHAFEEAAAMGASVLRLRVNKGNHRALRSYRRAGFRVIDALVADIGGGFVMDDFVLSRPVGTPLVKICGLSTAETLDAAIAAGADQVGLVFFPRSPRHVAYAAARDLAEQARGRVEIVALTVDATDHDIDAVMDAVRPDWLQLHGRETPERVAAIRSRTDRLVMKAIGIADTGDLEAAASYRGVADRLLFDAKPGKGAALPGGNGIAFEWSTVAAAADDRFMLSGGLSPANVAEAIRRARPAAVDVSSGVETAPGVKDTDLIAAFVRAARQP